MAEVLEVKLSPKEVERSEGLDNKGKFDFEDFFEKHKLQVILGGLGIFLLGVGIFSTVALSLKNQSSDIEIISDQEEQTSEICVHIAGAVEAPGLYKLASDARINDALVASGGLNAEADREWFNQSVNLAQKLSDGAKLYIPFKGEASPIPREGIVAGQQTNIFVDSQGKINLNTATLDQLDSLPGIGPAYAQRIIDARPFSSAEELKNISGIGEKTFEKIKDQITVF